MLDCEYRKRSALATMLGFIDLQCSQLKNEAGYEQCPLWVEIGHLPILLEVATNVRPLGDTPVT